MSSSNFMRSGSNTSVLSDISQGLKQLIPGVGRRRSSLMKDEFEVRGSARFGGVIKNPHAIIAEEDANDDI